MEPVTHILTGVALSRAGLNRRAAYTTLALAVAAELPDIDTLWSLGGPVESFTHHRGITHTFLGLPFEAALVVAGCYAVHRFRLRHQKPGRPVTTAPIAWGRLYFFSLLALLSHLLLDFTNNYGIRPFFPFNARWYAGSIVFIFDPLIFLLLLLPVVMPPIFALVASEVGSRRQPFRGRAWALASLILIACLYSLRTLEHAQAQQLASSATLAAPADPNADPAALTQATARLQPLQTLANPDPFNPFRWHVMSDYGDFYQLATANVRNGTLTPYNGILLKPQRTPALIAAESTPLGRAYMDWSPLPLISVSMPGDPGRTVTPQDTTRTATDILVTFRDPRFMGDIPLMRGPRAPLTGIVELDPALHPVRQTLDGRTER